MDQFEEFESILAEAGRQFKAMELMAKIVRLFEEASSGPEEDRNNQLQQVVDAIVSYGDGRVADYIGSGKV